MKSEVRTIRLPDIFLIFFKLGLVTFGGGYAMIPLIESEIVDKHKWMESGEIADIFAVSQSIPGAIAINSATFIGYKLAGRKGAIVATAGVVLPSLLVITLIAAFFSKFSSNPYAKAALSGIRPAVVALIFYAVYKVGKSSISDLTGLVVAAFAFILAAVFDVHAILIILAGALFGLALFRFDRPRVDRIVEREREAAESKAIESEAAAESEAVTESEPIVSETATESEAAAEKGEDHDIS